jgi:hypothetical protein
MVPPLRFLQRLLGTSPGLRNRRLATCRRQLLVEQLEDRFAPATVALGVSGFNQDLIFAAGETSARAGTTTTFDGVNVLYEAGAGSLPTANGLPASGTFTSPSGVQSLRGELHPGSLYG